MQPGDYLEYVYDNGDGTFEILPAEIIKVYGGGDAHAVVYDIRTNDVMFYRESVVQPAGTNQVNTLQFRA